jgi:hypothetical protein
MSVGDGIGLATLLVLLFNYLQGRSNGGKIEQVHGLVNDRASKQDTRIEQLTHSLEGSDTPVPARPNGGSHAN